MPKPETASDEAQQPSSTPDVTAGEVCSVLEARAFGVNPATCSV